MKNGLGDLADSADQLAAVVRNRPRACSTKAQSMPSLHTNRNTAERNWLSDLGCCLSSDRPNLDLCTKHFVPWGLSELSRQTSTYSWSKVTSLLKNHAFPLQTSSNSQALTLIQALSC